jgi:hypothetical protein
VVKTLVIIILLFNGTVVKDRISFTPPIDIMDCWSFGNTYYEVMSTHRWGDQKGAPNFKFLMRELIQCLEKGQQKDARKFIKKIMEELNN